MRARPYPVYYNEIDSYCVDWLLNLMHEGLIPQGVMDDRPVQKVSPDDVKGYTQCHFFAGIGGWPYALRLARWPEDRSVWTGSCPCPPFSVAGCGSGLSDPRHLWPEWFRLIRECHPPVIFGEQVDGAVKHGWLDLVSSELEVEDYAVGAAVFGACGVGAPHRRNRLYFVAHSRRTRCQGNRLQPLHGEGQEDLPFLCSPRPSSTGLLVHPPSGGCGECGDAAQPGRCGHADCASIAGELGDAGSQRLPLRECEAIQGARRGEEGGATAEPSEALGVLAHTGYGACRKAYTELVRPGPVNGFWRGADWLFCRDGKWRAVAPGSFPLAHGIPSRVGRLRACGNAIVPQAAAAFILAASPCLGDRFTMNHDTRKGGEGIGS